MKKILSALLLVNSFVMPMDLDQMDPSGDSSGVSSRDEQELRFRKTSGKSLSKPVSPAMSRASSPRPPSPVVMLSEPHDSNEVSCDLGFYALGCCCTCGIFPLITVINYCAKLKQKLKSI